MSTPTPPPRRDPGSSGTGPALAGIGVAVLAILCCAGPALLAAGVLGAVGGGLSNPWVITAAVLVALGAVAFVVRRRRSGRAECCPPRSVTDPAARVMDADRIHPEGEPHR